MKIAILVPFFPPKWSAGTEIATYNIAKYLFKRGHEVHVITSLDEGLLRDEFEDGFWIHRIKWRKMRILGPLLFWINILRILKKTAPEIIHVQGIRIGVPGFLAKKFLKKPYIVYCRGSEVYLPWSFKKSISKLILNGADAIISLTENMKEEIQKLCSKDILVIPNGVDLSRFENLSTREKIREEMGLNNKDKIIIFVGTLRKIKGVQYLIKAMDVIGKKVNNARLVIVGSGEEKETLEQLTCELDIEDFVTFTGRIPNEKVPEYMAASDVFVLPSLSEGFPNVLLESMGSGLPIVATKVGGLPCVLKDGENGFLIDPENPGQIAEKVLLLLMNDELRNKISRNNREKVKKYSWESVVGHLDTVYLRVIKKS